jgi:hypothetical protein
MAGETGADDTGEAGEECEVGEAEEGQGEVNDVDMAERSCDAKENDEVAEAGRAGQPSAKEIAQEIRVGLAEPGARTRTVPLRSAVAV